MADAPRLLAVVPARGGSKRLPGKNLLPLHGRPLLRWTVEAALACGRFARVLVSTDDAAIAGEARGAGADVPWLRPAALATDTAATVDVLRHALEWQEREHGGVDAVVLLQPTSPFRRAADLHAAADAFAAHGERVVSVSPAHPHPAWCFRVEDGAMQPFLGWDGLRLRSQDLPAAWALNGSIYVIPAAALRAGEALLAPPLRALCQDHAAAAIDIDDAADFARAQAAAPAFLSEDSRA